jgi:hypothetical protein
MLPFGIGYLSQFVMLLTVEKGIDGAAHARTD